MHRYYELIKPGIVYGNVMTAAAAFVFALHHAPAALSSQTIGAAAYAPLLFATIFGLGFSIASACVINNVFDRDIDARMERTKDRAIPQKQISIPQALIFAAVLGIAGIGLLFFYTNWYALLFTFLGVATYLFLYTPAKRFTVHSTVIGAIAGAMPPVVGYTAVSGSIDGNAVLLFLILVCWQVPHFFAIALYRLKDYAEAGLPVMPVQRGLTGTLVLMVLYTFLFASAVFSFAVVARLGVVYTLLVGSASIGWLLLSLSGFRKPSYPRFARLMFFYSLLLLLLFSALLLFA